MSEQANGVPIILAKRMTLLVREQTFGVNQNETAIER